MTAAAPIAIVVAPPASADCVNSGGTTLCSQGEVRGADGVPRAATPVVPYPCEYDWYCDTNTYLDVDWDPGGPGGIDPGGPGRPGGPGGSIPVARAVPVETVASDDVDQQPNDPSNHSLKEAIMLPSARSAHRAVIEAIGVGALAGAMLFGPAATAAAQPPIPPPCTAADLARVMSGVSFDTSNYLTTHPDVNGFFTSLKGQPKDQIQGQIQSYLDANPLVRDELQRIRQPSADFRQRCGAPSTP